MMNTTWCMGIILFLQTVGLLLVLKRVRTYKYCDAMTQLYNKLYLEKVTTKMIRQRKLFTICFFDIDKFKMLNDTYGHLAGDEGIISFSNSLCKYFSPKAVIARIGGDEFAVVIPDSKKFVQMDECLEQLKNQKFIHNNIEIHFTVSIGVCHSDKDILYKIALEKADRNLYEQKKKISSLC